MSWFILWMVVSAIFWLSGLSVGDGALGFEEYEYALTTSIDSLSVGGAVVMFVFAMCHLLRIL